MAGTGAAVTGVISVAMTPGLRGWAAITAAVSLAVTAIALAFALAAGASAHADDQELSQRLVPAATAAGAVLAGYTAESGALRDYATDGQAASLESYRDAAGRMPGYQARAAALVRGYPHMPARLAAERAALAAWQARVAGPQLSAAARGDFARALLLADNVSRNRPYALAVRTTVAALQAQITSAQASVVARLTTAQRLSLMALVVVCAVVAVVAACVMVVVRRWLLRPFAVLREAAELVAAGHYDTPIPAVGPAELADLSRVAERMRIRLVAALDEAGQAQSRLQTVNATLEGKVQERTAHLEAANQNLAAFTYSVAHDLRTPLRAISGYAEILAEEYRDSLDGTGRGYAGRIQAAGEHMGAVLDGLSHLSRVSRAEINLQDVQPQRGGHQDLRPPPRPRSRPPGPRGHPGRHPGHRGPCPDPGRAGQPARKRLEVHRRTRRCRHRIRRYPRPRNLCLLLCARQRGRLRPRLHP